MRFSTTFETEVERGFPALIMGERIAKLACCCPWKVAQREWV